MTPAELPQQDVHEAPDRPAHRGPAEHVERQVGANVDAGSNPRDV
jgi:hypothetical protein